MGNPKETPNKSKESDRKRWKMDNLFYGRYLKNLKAMVIWNHLEKSLAGEWIYPSSFQTYRLEIDLNHGEKAANVDLSAKLMEYQWDMSINDIVWHKCVGYKHGMSMIMCVISKSIYVGVSESETEQPQMTGLPVCPVMWISGSMDCLPWKAKFFFLEF